MQPLIAFITTSMDGYFADSAGDMSWAHKSDPEWLEFVSGNASQGGTLLFGDDLPGEMHKLKQQSGKGICILGSGTIVTQLAEARLIDELQIVVSPIVLGKGKTPFETLKQRLPLKLLKTRSFTNGNVIHYYGPAA